MKESYREEVANHSGPEPCEGTRKGAFEALSRGVRRLGIELRNSAVRVADGFTQIGRQNVDGRKRETIDDPRSQRPQACGQSSMRENREAPWPSEKLSDREGKAESHNPSKNGNGESYSGVVPAKQPNKGERSLAEVVEGRPLTKENTDQSNSGRTQSRMTESSGLGRVREAARKDKKQKFTSIMHHVSIELLRESYHSLKKLAAPGVDGVKWKDYGEDLEARLIELEGRVQRGAYRAQPSRRVWIPKADGKKRPLGIAALEDKIVQRAVGTVLEQIWEEDFLDFSHGFRPGRSQQDALDELYVGIMRKNVDWILDLDIRAFFDKLQHEWLIQFVEHRIGDPRIVRLIQKWLKAGVIEDGQWMESKEGSPQGSVISPMLANLYLHYALDVWVKRWIEKEANGDMIIVRYADDAVLGFQKRADADRFLQELKERLKKFGLELHPDKTRLIEFGRFAAERRKKRGEGKPETFDFLGFTHICGRTHETKKFTVKRRTISKRMTAKLREIGAELYKRMHEGAVKTGEWLQQVVRGYFQYHAIPGNWQRLKTFRNDVWKRWYRALRRRSQRTRLNWKRFIEGLGAMLPPIQILQLYPTERFDAKQTIRGRNRVR